MFRVVPVILLTLFLFSGCSKQEEKINIGFVGTLSGRYSDLGQALLQGVMLAVENSPNASKINLIVKDDFGKPAEGVKIIAEMEKAGVKYILGPCLSSVAVAVAPLLEPKGMYMLSPTVSTSDLAGKKDNFFRTMPHNSYRQAEIISSYLRERLDVKSIVMIYDSRNASYSYDIVRKFTEAFLRKGGEVRDVRPFNPESGDSLQKLIENDIPAPPDMYYVIGSAMDTSLIIWQIKKAGLKSEVLIRKWAASNEFYRLGGEAVEGVKMFAYYIDLNSPEFLDFRNMYKARFQKDPAGLTGYGYEAGRMIAYALPELIKGEDFAGALNKAAEGNRLLLDFSFDDYGDAVMPLHFFVIKDGETVYQGKAE